MYFCAYCTTGKEKQVKTLIEKKLSAYSQQFNVWFPEKENTEKRNGKTENVNRPLFPGYLFIWWDGEDETLFPFRELRVDIPDFKRILMYGDKSHDLKGNDLLYAKWIHENSGFIKKSKVILTEGQKIHVSEGPLVGFDGNIVKLDKHHKLITVRFNVEGNPMDIKFSVDFIEKQTAISNISC